MNYFFILLFLVINLSRVYAIVVKFKKNGYFMFFDISEWTSFISISIFFVILVLSLKKYFYFEYKRIRKSMILFYIGEMLILVII